MTRLNSKVETTTGTLALIGLVPAFLAIIITLAINMLGWAREDGASKQQLQSVQQEIKEVRSSQQKLSEEIKEFKDDLQEERVQRARQEGFKTGVTAAGK